MQFTKVPDYAHFNNFNSQKSAKDGVP